MPGANRTPGTPHTNVYSDDVGTDMQHVHTVRRQVTLVTVILFNCTFTETSNIKRASNFTRTV